MIVTELGSRKPMLSTMTTVAFLLLVAQFCAVFVVFSHAFVVEVLHQHHRRHQKRIPILLSSKIPQSSEVPSTGFDSTSDSRRRDRRKLQSSNSRGNNNKNHNNNPEAAETYQTNLKIAELAKQCGRPREPLGKRIDAACQAYNLLRQMKNPDTVAYNSVLKAFSKVSPCSLSQKSLQQISSSSLRKKQAENDVVDDCDLDDPTDSLVFQSAMSLSSPEAASATSITAAEHAEQLVEEMKVVHRNQLEANQRWYNDLALDHLSDDEVSAGPPRVYVKPNVRSYSTAMDAFARVKTRYAATKAQDLLRELQQRYDDSDQQDGALEPNLITYNTCLSAWARAGCCYECLELFDRMPIQPDVISYNAVLHALARSRWSDAGIRAQKLLESMIDSSSGDNVKPNGRSYTTTSDAWSQCGRPDMAESLLRRQLELYDSTGGVSYRPNSVSYATVLHAYATSSSPDDNKAVKAFQLVQDMTRRGIYKNRVVWNNLLHCFATSRPGNPTTIELVRKLYRQVLEHSDPDHYTFGTVLKASSNLLVWKTDQSFAPSVFREACRRGQVSDGVLWQLNKALPVDAYRELVGSGEININDIPLEWKRNVRGEGEHQQQRSYNRRTRSTSNRTGERKSRL